MRATDQPGPGPAGPAASASTARIAAFLGVALVLGLVVRAWLLWLAPTYGFFGDHVDYVCWGRQATRTGVLDLYRSPPPPCIAESFFDDKQIRQPSGTGERLNYPPLAAYVFTLQHHLLQRFDPAGVANTVAARTAYAASTTLAELIIALGVLVLVRSFAGTSAAAAAFAATWLAPPLLLDGPFWGQTESWVLAPAVWMLIAMTRERWLAAGVCWGLALALKPSGLLFAPLWLYAFLFRAARVRIVLGGVVALVVLNLLALPFWLDSGRTWLDVTYLDNFVYKLHWTTAMTFNVWYVDLLLTSVLDGRTPLFGVARDVWGFVLLAAGIAGAYALARRWERRVAPAGQRGLGMVPLAALVTLAAVMLPTRVHSTYGTFTTPFLIATAFLIPRAAIGVVVCTLTISLQILSWQWGTLLAMHYGQHEEIFPPARQAQRQAWRAIDAPREWALTIANLAAAAAVTAAIATAKPRRPRTPA